MHTLTEVPPIGSTVQYVGGGDGDRGSGLAGAVVTGWPVSLVVWAAVCVAFVLGAAWASR